MRVLIVALALGAAALAGCVAAPPVDGGDDGGAPDALRMGPPYPAANPQLASHPSWGWPTFATIAEGMDDAPNRHLLPIPYRPLPETITGLEHLGQGPGTGAGIGLMGHYAVVPGWIGAGMVVDVSDPENPVKVAGFDPPARDVDFILYPDGRLIAVLATDSMDVHVMDLTDPRDPELLTSIRTLRGSHNVAVVPGTPILYNSNSAGGGLNPLAPSGGTEIYDLTDPSDPRLIKDWANGYGCHDITFWIGGPEAKQRAYCAGLEVTQIWDVGEPRDPQVLVSIPFPHGQLGLPSLGVAPVSFSHLAMVNHDATVLIVGDETGGGLLAACDANVWEPSSHTSLSGPAGNLWLYDIASEEDPVLLSFFSPGSHLVDVVQGADATAGCTAHFGRLVEDRGLLPMAFYGAGVVLIDIRDPANPSIVDQWNPGTNTWDVWYYQGYLVTGDLNRGMDVLTFT